MAIGYGRSRAGRGTASSACRPTCVAVLGTPISAAATAESSLPCSFGRAASRLFKGRPRRSPGHARLGATISANSGLSLPTTAATRSSPSLRPTDSEGAGVARGEKVCRFGLASCL